MSFNFHCELVVGQDPTKARVQPLDHSSASTPASSADEEPSKRRKLSDSKKVPETRKRGKIYLEPCPLVMLKSRDQFTIDKLLNSPYTVCIAELAVERNGRWETLDGDYLRGQTLASPSILRSRRVEGNPEVAYFVFPCLTVHKEGSFKLKLSIRTLYEVQGMKYMAYVTEHLTKEFHVFANNAPHAPVASNDFAKMMYSKGLKIPIVKGPKERKTKKDKTELFSLPPDATLADVRSQLYNGQIAGHGFQMNNHEYALPVPQSYQNYENGAQYLDMPQEQYAMSNALSLPPAQTAQPTFVPPNIPQSAWSAPDLTSAPMTDYSQGSSIPQDFAFDFNYPAPAFQGFKQPEWNGS